MFHLSRHPTLSFQRKYPVRRKIGGEDLRLWADESVGQEDINNYDDREDCGYPGIHGTWGAKGRDHA